jgi:hypothetical protein
MSHMSDCVAGEMYGTEWNPSLVRLKVSMHRRVKVPLWRGFPPETESNCVLATGGGEQLEVNG